LTTVCPALRWRYRVHEQVLLAVREAGHVVRWTDVVIAHVGYQEPAGTSRKLERNVRLLEKQGAERPDDPVTLFNLGWAYHQLGRTTESLRLLRRSLELAPPALSTRRHPRSGLYKRRLSLDELLHLAPERVRVLAAEPEPFALPGVRGDGGRAAADWSDAVRAVRQETEVKAQRHAVGDGPVRGDRETEIARRLRSLTAALAACENLQTMSQGNPPAPISELLRRAIAESGVPYKAMASVRLHRLLTFRVQRCPLLATRPTRALRTLSP
jgi:hypothetical protein